MTWSKPQPLLRVRRSWFAALALGYACGGKSATPKPETSDSGGVGGSSGTGVAAGSSTGGTQAANGGSSDAVGAGAGHRATGGHAGSGGTGAKPIGGTSGGTMPGGGTTLIPGGARAGAGGSESGAGGTAGETCDIDALWKAITSQAGVTACSEASPTLGPDEQLGARRGAVVLDDEGRVVDITGRTGDNRQRWLDGLADQRWPCLAGTTIGYQCLSPD